MMRARSSRRAVKFAKFSNKTLIGVVVVVAATFSCGGGEPSQACSPVDEQARS